MSFSGPTIPLDPGIVLSEAHASGRAAETGHRRAGERSRSVCLRIPISTGVAKSLQRAEIRNPGCNRWVSRRAEGRDYFASVGERQMATSSPVAIDPQFNGQSCSG
jgi:hypothetical protein